MTENSLPKVSVILPSLNVSGYIKETLDSVMNQSMSDLEIICVDAGSTDGTLDIINAAIKSDPRIRLIMSDIRSYGYQVNLGIDESRGEYIAILETDDYVEPTMYSKLYEIAKSEKADYVKADYDAFFTQEDGTYYFFPRHTFGDKSLYGKAVNPKDHVNIGMNDWYLWQGLYSKEFIVTNNIRFSQTPGAAFQDIGFLFWTGLYAERAVYINDILYHYRIDRDGASSNLGKGLKFSYAEFTNIKRIMGDLRQYDLQSKKLLFARMIKSFVSSYSHISEDEQSRSERREAYEWFCGEIRNAYNEGIIDDSIILSGHIERLKLLLESANMGLVDAISIIGFLLNREKRYEEANAYFKKAAEMGDHHAIHNLGNAYIYARGMEQDVEKGILLWMKAASMGNPESMCAIGTCYLRGEVFKQNTNKAIEYLTRSAELGNTLAMQRLVEVYHLAGDHQKAQYWENMQNPN